MDGTQLFSKMRRPVIVTAEQTLRYSDVRKADHPPPPDRAPARRP